MRKLAVAAVLLCACSKEDYKNQKPPEEDKPAVAAERKPPPPPPKKALTPEEMGKCDLKATGGFTAEETSLGGKSATNVSYWFTEAERNSMMGVDGFVVNCHGPKMKFSILPGGGMKDGMPFAPKKYTFKGGKGDANVMVTFGPKLTLGDPSGTVDITAFDKKHIAGTIDLSGKTQPGNKPAKVTGKFDFACPGFSGCE